MRTYVLSFILAITVLMAYGDHASAQASQGNECSYKTRIVVYEDNTSNTPLPRSSADLQSSWGVYNNKQGRLIKAGFFGDSAELLYNNQTEKLDGGYERYRPNEKASVTLSGLGIGTKWRIKDIFCDDSKGTFRACPKNIGSQARTQTISDFTVNCGVDMTYGWVVERIGTTPKPTSTPGPVLDSTAYLLSIWDTNNPIASCNLAVDTKVGFATQHNAYCKSYQCKNSSGATTGLIVDYQNQVANTQLIMSAQTNRCSHAEIMALSPSCATKLQRLEQFRLPYRDTMRCVWQNIDASGAIQCRNLEDGVINPSEQEVCNAELNSSTPSTTPTPTQGPTQSPRPSVPITSTPKSCSCDRIDQPHLNENVCNSGCEVFHTVGNSCNYTSDCTKRTKITPRVTVTPKPSVSITKQPTPPIKTNSSFSREKIILNWNFNALEDKKKDTHIWALKVGLCDSPSTAAYSRKTPNAGGNGAKCKWYNTEVTHEILTNAKPGGRIGKPDTRMRSTRPAVDMAIDYDNKPVERDKIYYITCQYYAGTTATTEQEIRKAAANDTDEWRRCEPRAATVDEQLVFLNILDPTTYISRVPDDVVLSDGGQLQTPPAEGQAYLGVGLQFDFDYFKHLPHLYWGKVKVRAIRVGICPYEPVTGGDYDACMFSPPQPQSDLVLDLARDPLKSQKYFFFTTDSTKLPIKLSKNYYATCQYLVQGVLDPKSVAKGDWRDLAHPEFTEIRRCWPKLVTSHAYFSKNPKIDLLWKNVLDTEGSFPLQNPSYGSLPLFSQLEPDDTSVDFTVCDPLSNKCSHITQDLFAQDQNSARGTSLVTDVGGERVLHGSDYTVFCTTSSGKSCPQLQVRADDPIYLNTTGSSIILTSASTRCDQNNDHVCNALDIARCSTATPAKSCDINLDGTVNATDFSVSLKQLGE